MNQKLSNFDSAQERNTYLEKKLKIRLSHIKKAAFPETEKVFCENIIGATSIPLGVAGPIHIKGSQMEDDYYIPLATTEGALVASVSRGGKAVSLSGGILTAVETVGATRAPVFEVEHINEALEFKKWIHDNFLFLQKESGKTSNHIKLLKSEVSTTGRYVYVRFYFDCDQAMGMNMATIATEKMVQVIKKETKISCVSISGNYCVDKKPAWLNFISGRGRKVWAEAVIKQDVIKKVLKTTPKELYEVWLLKCLMGSVISGSMGFNAHFANIVAAFYLATGQDLAHVVEGSLGVTTVKVLPSGDLYFSVYLPAVMLGVVGGGTRLQIKKEAISITKVTSSDALAQVLAGAVLAGELSLLASLQEGSLAEAHASLGR